MSEKFNLEVIFTSPIAEKVIVMVQSDYYPPPFKIVKDLAVYLASKKTGMTKDEFYETYNKIKMNNKGFF